MSKRPNRALDAARAALAGPVVFDDFVAKLNAKDRNNVTRHVAALETEDDAAHAKLWKRLFRSLATLAPHAPGSIGQQAFQFYVPDGKYRMQVFALEDLRDGKVLVYAEDVLEIAQKAGLLGAPEAGSSETFAHPIKGSTAGHCLLVESLTAANTPNPSPAYKHMLGWNRKAMRITLGTRAAPEQIEAAEVLCAIAAQQWQKKADAKAEAKTEAKPA